METLKLKEIEQMTILPRLSLFCNTNLCLFELYCKYIYFKFDLLIYSGNSVKVQNFELPLNAKTIIVMVTEPEQEQ